MALLCQNWDWTQDGPAHDTKLVPWGEQRVGNSEAVSCPYCLKAMGKQPQAKKNR